MSDLANSLVVSCGRSSVAGAAAIVYNSSNKSTKRMYQGDSHGFSVPNGQHLKIERLGHFPVALRNDYDRPASITQSKPTEVKKKLAAGKSYQLPEKAVLTVSV